jgi:hypothetical protein
MFDVLNKYKLQDHFFFKPNEDLFEECNAPTDKSGVYIIYALCKGKIELVYIGHSGEKKADGTILSSNDGLGGLKDCLVNEKQFGDARNKSFKVVMDYEKIDGLDIYWYVTHSDKFVDCPKHIEKNILQQYFDIYGELPKWNKIS